MINNGILALLLCQNYYRLLSSFVVPLLCRNSASNSLVLSILFRLGILSVLRLCGRRQKIIELIGLRCILGQIRYQPGAHLTVGANTVFGKRLSNVPRSKFLQVPSSRRSDFSKTLGFAPTSLSFQSESQHENYVHKSAPS